MDEDLRVLSNLIETLEDVKGKLSSMDYDREWIRCVLSKDKSRSYLNIRNVLELLVVKTVEGKGYDEDIASIYNQHKPFLEKYFQKLFTSEEFLMEATNLPKMPLKFEFLHSSLTTFQDFLGDILHSVCQISSCQLKLPSKILVKDLLKLKNQYLSIWDLISCAFGENKYRRNSACSLMGESKSISSQVGEVQKSLQTSLWEMSRVKLEIEHYFKCNLIEMQFTKSLTDADNRESVHSKEDVFESNSDSEYSLLKRINSSSPDDTSSKKIKSCGFSTKKQLNNEVPSFPSLILTESYHNERTGNSDKFPKYPPTPKTWNEIRKNMFSDSLCGDFIHRPLVFPPNCLFVDPKTVFIQSKQNVQKRNSLPKVYSVDSCNESTAGSGLLCQKNNNDDINHQICYDDRVKTVKITPTTKSMVEDDLFIENKNKRKNQADSYSICLQEKLSSLFGMLQSSETNQEDDIFKETTLKIERSDLTFSQTSQNSNKLKCNSNDENDAHDKFSLRTSYNIPKNHPFGDTYKNETTSEEKSNENVSNIKNKIPYKIPFYFGKSKDDYNRDKPKLQRKEVIYDERSLIELYRTKKANPGLNTGSTPGELSSFSLWPVTAEYIQVSRSKKPHKMESVSSNNSISLSKTFGKSLYSLHLNKKYEQKQLYEGDLLVLDNPERPVRKESSSCSLLNQPYSVFNREENCNPFEKINDTQNVFGSKINVQMQVLKEKNQPSFKKGRDLNSKQKNLKDMKKTLAVHYKDCEDPFKATGKSFNKENFDFLKLNGFDENNHWNSFISIFTSKVGPTAQINHHRMFRKVINTFTSDSLACNNVFGNVHTLTSNGGPFRLFDINGYPLTDSAGNVLKDPYGKSVVTLDSTGFPKDDVKVFDAAGNSPNDINFDPTQKPKTNSIIIKLTDNFKRPLHLFDKYGRPLTDSCGKLLVNIHGRPLLRFDNFGRPNTDYRGGPLYTDNGYRWSYKTGESLSSNQVSNESLGPKKLCGLLDTESRKNSHENFSVQDKSDEKNKSTFKSAESKTVDDRKNPVLNSSKSDIWIKVENVLQKLPKNKKIEPKMSQTSVIINNVTIQQTPIEKELLKSIIYHDSIIQQDINHINTIHLQPFTSHKTFLDFPNINSYTANKTLTDKFRTYCVGKVLDTDGYKPYSTTPFPFQNSTFVKSNCSKSLILDHQKPKHIPSNQILNEQSFKVSQAFTCDAGNMWTNLTDAPLTSYPKNDIKNKLSYLTSTNHNYLNNLCNQILKHEIINYSEKNKHTINSVGFKKNTDWTGTSNTEFLSSIGSKYTTGFTTQTESPVYLSDTSKDQLLDIETKNKYYKRYLKEQLPFDYCKRDTGFVNEDKYGNEYYQDNIKKYIECLSQESNGKITEQFRNISANPKDTISINILNKDNKHYEIKVTEMLSKIINPKLNFSLFSTGKNNINDKSNSLLTYPKTEIETSSKCKHSTRNSMNKLIDHKYNITENDKEKLNHSLFCFSSDENIESTPTLERNIESSYSHKAIYSLDSNVCKERFKVHNEETKHTNKTFIYEENYENEGLNHSMKPLTQSEQSKEPNNKKDRVQKNKNFNGKSTYPVKKPVNSNRECNLASFFGSPVKYVLNKLDGKRSLKLNKINMTAKKKAFSNSKESARRSSDTTYPKDKSKPINNIKIKTLYDINKSSKRGMLSSSEKADIKNHKDKLSAGDQDTLLAFRSRSCTGLLCQDKNEIMCYSGDSQSSNFKKLFCGSTKPRKSMSANSCIAGETSRDKDPIRQSTKYEQRKDVPKNGQYSLKPNATRRRHNKLDYSTQKCCKSRNGSSGRHSKSPFFSSQTKAKEISLFRKVEPEGKYMLKIKK